MANATLRKIVNVFLYVVALTAFLAISGELFIRAILVSPDGYYIWTPNLHLNFEPSPEATPGVTGTGRFMANSLGLRSDELAPNTQQIIYAFGGSTAIELYLDQDEMWSHLIQERLNAIPGYPRTWVGNLAKSSLATLHNLMHFDYLLPQLPKAHLFINLVGVNDLQLALKSSYLRDMSYEQNLSWAYSHTPIREPMDRLAWVRFYKRMREWREKSKTGVLQTHHADGFLTWKQCRRTAPADRIVDTLPDLSEPLATYRKNLNALVDRAQAYGAPMIFMTQPTIWKEKMSQEEFNLLLAGGLGPNNEWCVEKRYYSPRALAEGMEWYNQTLLEICAKREIFCIDLARRMPKEAQYYFDDMHFSEEGARKVAEIAVSGILDLQKRRADSIAMPESG